MGPSWQAGWGLFDEYATGEGPEIRRFDGGSTFVSEMMQSPGIETAVSAFYEHNQGAAPGSLESTRSFYRLSPNMEGSTSDILTSLHQAAAAHADAIQSGVRMMVGGYYTVVSESTTPGSVQVAVWNDTTANSHFAHRAESFSRGSETTPGGSTQQWFVWDVPLDAARLRPPVPGR